MSTCKVNEVFPNSCTLLLWLQHQNIFARSSYVSSIIFYQNLSVSKMNVQFPKYIHILSRFLLFSESQFWFSSPILLRIQGQFYILFASILPRGLSNRGILRSYCQLIIVLLKLILSFHHHYNYTIWTEFRSTILTVSKLFG